MKINSVVLTGSACDRNQLPALRSKFIQYVCFCGIQVNTVSSFDNFGARCRAGKKSKLIFQSPFANALFEKITTAVNQMCLSMITAPVRSF
jgi:hypothetical protein